jgi:hypothetical protein
MPDKLLARLVSLGERSKIRTCTKPVRLLVQDVNARYANLLEILHLEIQKERRSPAESQIDLRTLVQDNKNQGEENNE